MSSHHLSDRLRRGDAAALLELAQATHGRALAVVRAAGKAEDAEGLLLDAYVALYLRRADVPDTRADEWALAEVLAYCAQRTGAAGRHVARAPRAVPLGESAALLLRGLVMAAARGVGSAVRRAFGHAAGGGATRAARREAAPYQAATPAGSVG
jgi:hypothetical protein